MVSVIQGVTASIQVVHGDGKSILFWFDPWLHGSRLVDKWPDLVMAVPTQQRRKRTLESALSNGGWSFDITSALRLSPADRGIGLKRQNYRVWCHCR
jgi:hypothetical protein